MKYGTIKFPLLWLSGFRYLQRHPVLYLLSVTGVALGVAVVISIDLANESARRAFSLSAQTITGQATHQIEGATGRVPDSVYVALRTRTAYRKSAPVIEGYVSLENSSSIPGTDGVAAEEYSGRVFRLLGIDPLAEEPFRTFTGQQAGIDLAGFISSDNLVFLSGNVAASTGLEPGDSFQVKVSGRSHNLILGGLIEPRDAYSQQALENIMVADIGTAQRLFDLQGYLSRIDLIIPDDQLSPNGHRQTVSLQQIESLLPDGLHITSSNSRTETLSQLTRAFELNLRALSLLALLVGVFLIYNTITFSVVQRRPFLGRLRSIGVGRSQVFGLILLESLFIALPGTLIGLAGGYLLSKYLVLLVTQTINDLYFVVSVQQVTLSPVSLAKGLFLGLGAPVLAALWPAREAAHTPILRVLRRSTRDSPLQHHAWRMAGAGILVLIFGIGSLFISLQSIVAGYLSLLLIISGYSLMVPGLILLFLPFFSSSVGFFMGLTGKMAVRGIAREIGRTSVATAALVVAIAAAIGVGLMVNSFRTTVDQWLTSQLQADLYIQAPGSQNRSQETRLDPRLTEQVVQARGVREAHTIQRLDVRIQNRRDRLIVIETSSLSRKSYHFREKKPALWDRFEVEPVIMVSESYAWNHQTQLGDRLALQTERGIQEFEILGIYYDYSSDSGLISMSRPVYLQFFEDQPISGIALYLEEGYNPEDLIPILRAETSGIQEVLIQSNRALRESSMEIFDRTFTITWVLRILAVWVAFTGVLSAFMALQMERSREMAVLRANGVTPAQLWAYITAQTGVMGLIAGLLSIPLGLTMASVLIYVINLRSFGWTLQLQHSPEILLQAMLVAVGAAILAGLYPSWKISRIQPSEALRYE